MQDGGSVSADSPSASAVICTFRGKQFVERQLETIMAQTRVPDELVIFDDASDDGTYELLQSLARVLAVPVSLHQQKSRIGVAGNFSQAMAAAQGDVILLSDQDDEWSERRVEVSLKVLVSDGCDLMFSDAEIIDANGKPLGRRFWDEIRFKDDERRQCESGECLEVLLRHSVMMGATMGFLSKWRTLLFPVDVSGLHDVWIAVLLAAVGRVVAVPEPLVRYRQHSGNQVGVRPRSPSARLTHRRSALARYGDEVAQVNALCARLSESNFASSRTLSLMRQKLEHLEARAAIGRGDRRLRTAFSELRAGRYARFSRGWESALFDLVL